MPVPTPQSQEADDLPAPSIAIDARQQDAYWSEAYSAEPYARADRDYEDYAPAYCVGYVGYAQYGGSCGESEKSLCANWERIKGASRLSLDEALAAIGAAWERGARQAREAGRSPALAPSGPVVRLGIYTGIAAGGPGEQASPAP